MKYDVDMENKSEVTYSEIGKGFRLNYKNYRAKKIIIESLLFSIPVIVASLIAYGLNSITIYSNQEKMVAALFITLFIPLPLMIIFFIFIYKRTKRRDRELLNDDEYLGKKYKYTCKRVRGSAKNKTLKLLIVLPIICYHSLPFFVVLLATTIINSEKIQQQEELITIQGIVQSKRGVGFGHEPGIEIKLKDNDTIYLIWSDAWDACDRSLSSDNIEGLLAHLSCAPSDKEYAYVYSFKIDEKEYLSYDGYLSECQRELAWRYSLSAVLLLITISCIVGIITTATYLRINKPKEDIEL